jgi:hypothetical protein
MCNGEFLAKTIANSFGKTANLADGRGQLAAPTVPRPVHNRDEQGSIRSFNRLDRL